MKPVPVLPAIDRPGTRACLAVPRQTTSRIICCIWPATSGLTTSCVADAGISRTSPDASTVALTSLGATYTPSLAIVLTAEMSWIGLLATP